ncbi:MAG: hypothetical protein GY822_18260 [Deltaproteobacteria bacterium]|nr:hypothetical protein [Deltaproteobacteria bacterium]
MLSKIFEWYADDFTPSTKEWIAKEAPDLPFVAAEKKDKQKNDAVFRKYDWNLNARSRR